MSQIDVGIGINTHLSQGLGDGKVGGQTDKIRVSNGLPANLTSPVAGDAYFDPALSELRIHDGTKWWGYATDATSTSTTSSSTSSTSTSSTSTSSTSSSTSSTSSSSSTSSTSTT